MTDNDFWNLVDATEEEKQKGSYYLKERGLEEHINVLYYLQSFMNNANRKIAYKEIATVLRYDKRIRRCLFKYISVVEERLRAHFLDYYRDQVSLIIPTKIYKDAMGKYKNDFYKTITHLLFSELVILFKKQNDAFKSSVYVDVENINSNLNALVKLRNQVCHNKFLLNNLELVKCKYNGSEQASLNANIRNLYNLSDVYTREKLIEEINACSERHTSKFKNQVNWKLPIDVAIAIKID